MPTRFSTVVGEMLRPTVSATCFALTLGTEEGNCDLGGDNSKWSQTEQLE